MTALIPELSVSDFERSRHFYTVVLPFKVAYERPEDSFAMLSLGDCRMMIEKVNGYWQTGELAHPFGRGINFQIQVEDVDRLYRRLIEHDYAITIDIQDNWYRADDREVGQREFLVMDPDGYLLRFVQSLGERKR